MAKRGQSFESIQWNQILEDVSKQIAKEMDPPRDELPLDRKHYDYFLRGRSLLKGMSESRGQDLDHDTAMVLQDLVFSIPNPPKGQTEYTEEQKYKEGEKIRRGPIYNYPKYLAKNGFEPERFPFNRYFAMTFKRRAYNRIEKRFVVDKTNVIPHFPVAPGGQFEEEGPGGLVSEGVLSDPSSPAPSHRAEEAEKREILDRLIPEQLALIPDAKERKILSLFYRMHYQGGATLREVGERLDELGEQDSDYWPESGGMKWPTSTLGRYKDTIAYIMQRYYRQKSKERKSGAITPEEKRAIFQSRRA